MKKRATSTTHLEGKVVFGVNRERDSREKVQERKKRA
jgi:hypothetical protein